MQVSWRTWLEGGLKVGQERAVTRRQLLQVVCGDISQPAGVQAQPLQVWHGVPGQVRAVEECFGSCDCRDKGT